jgi:hypothetical protein
MLNFVYHGRIIAFPKMVNPTTHVLFCIELYRVADKYDVPTLLLHIGSSFKHKVNVWLDHKTPKNDNKAKEPISPESFCEVISKLYGLPNITISHCLVDVLLGQIDMSKPTKILQNDGLVSPLLELACEKVPEFGRDLCLHILRMSMKIVYGAERLIKEIGVTTQVKCPACEGIWRRSVSSSLSSYCYLCGHHAEDWEDNEFV